MVDFISWSLKALILNFFAQDFLMKVNLSACVFYFRHITPQNRSEVSRYLDSGLGFRPNRPS